MNYRQKVFFIFTLALLLAACMNSVAPEDIVTISFACKEYQRRLFEPFVKDFQKENPDIRVQFVSAEEASGQTQQGNVVVATSDDFGRVAAAADTFIWYAQLQATDWAYVLNLQPFLDAEPSFPTEDFYPGTLDDLRWKGELHGLPAEVWPVLIYYDKKMFDEEGLAYPTPGWTWDEFLEAANRLTRREADVTTRYGFVPHGYPEHIIAVIEQHGVPLWSNAIPSEPLFDSPEVAQVVRDYTDLALVHHVMPTLGLDMQAADALINEGKAAMWAGQVFQYWSRDNLGVVSLPQGIRPANPHDGYGFFAGAGTAHPDAAWRWLKYLSEHYQGDSNLNGILPARLSLGKDVQKRWNLGDDAKAAIEYAMQHPASPHNPLNWKLIKATFNILDGQADLEQALADAQAQALVEMEALAVATPAPTQAVVPIQPTTDMGDAETVITFAPASDANMSVYRSVSATFHQSHPEIRVEIVPSSNVWADGDSQSDCFAGEFPPQSAELRHIMRSLDSFLDTGGGIDHNDFYPALWSSQQVNGELWGIPYEADALMLYSNRARFGDKGLEFPESEWTFADFIEAAQSLSGDGQYGFTTHNGVYGDLLFALNRFGADLVDESHSPSAPTFDDPTVVDALAQYAAVSLQQSLTPGTPSSQSGWPDSIVVGSHPAGVETGNVAMWIDSISNYMFAPPLSFQVGVAPLPVQSSGSLVASTQFSVRAYYIAAHTAEPEACWEWLIFLSSQEETVQLLPARRSVAASSAWQGRVDAAALPAYLVTLEYAHESILQPDLADGWLIYTYPWLQQAFQETLVEGDAAQALAEAQRKADAYMICLEQGDILISERYLACAGEVGPNYPESSRP